MEASALKPGVGCTGGGLSSLCVEPQCRLGLEGPSSTSKFGDWVAVGAVSGQPFATLRLRQQLPQGAPGTCRSECAR